MSSEDIKSRMQRLSLLIHYYTFIDLASICSPSSIPELEITRIPAKKKQKQNKTKIDVKIFIIRPKTFIVLK